MTVQLRFLLFDVVGFFLRPPEASFDGVEMGEKERVDI
jgi:hypothetical protein